MKIISILLTLIVLSCSQCSNKEQRPFNTKITGINPVTYTDVVYCSNKDSVFVATFSGEISLRVNDSSKKEIITHVEDEIYALAYSKKRNEIIAATLESGIVIIDIPSGKQKQVLQLKEEWAVSLNLSPEEDRLLTFDLGGNNYIWTHNGEYLPMPLNDSFPNNFVRFFDARNNIYLSGRNTVSIWRNEQLQKEISVKGQLVDVDDDGNLLLLDFNKYLKYNIDQDTIAFSYTHPSWIRTLPSNDTIHDTYVKMELIAGLFAGDKILTAGLDRSVRVWDNKTGKLLADLLGPQGAITSIDLSQDKKQLVAVDTKGGVYFWDL